MKTITKALFTAAVCLAASLYNHALAQRPDVAAHVSNTFHFVVPAPLNRAAPLFGPGGERCWAGQHWNPDFIYPHPGEDVQGAVFKVAHGDHKSVWVNTLFDTSAGRMQYVALIPDSLVFTVDVKLTPVNSASTGVDVTYVRTALDPALNKQVRSMSKGDATSGPEWQADIENCLKKQENPSQ